MDHTVIQTWVVDTLSPREDSHHLLPPREERRKGSVFVTHKLHILHSEQLVEKVCHRNISSITYRQQLNNSLTDSKHTHPTHCCVCHCKKKMCRLNLAQCELLRLTVYACLQRQRAQQIVPCTVSQLMSAAQAEDVFRVGEVEVAQVTQMMS